MAPLGIVSRWVGPHTDTDLTCVWTHRVLAELKPNSLWLQTRILSAVWVFQSLPASAKHTLTRNTHTGFVMLKMLMQPSTLRPGLEANVTSLRRKKAFYSFSQFVSDWFEVKVAAGRRTVMLAKRLKKDGQRGGWQEKEGEEKKIAAYGPKSALQTPPVLMTLQ